MFHNDCPRVPVVRKCCFFVPIRKGILILAYANLVVALLTVPVLVFFVILAAHLSKENPEHYTTLTDASVAIGYVILEIGLTVLLLVAAHKRNVLLLKIYFYLGVIEAIVSLCVDLALFGHIDYIFLAIYFIGFFFYLYLLFLVYNVVFVIEEKSGVQYIAHQEPTLL